MKALTLTQPWATLVAIGAKKIETRSWRTDYRGPLAIHAAAGLGPVGGMKGLSELCVSQPFRDALRAGGYCDAGGIPELSRLPLGAIVAVCELRDCRIIGRELNGDATIAADDMISFVPILGDERAFGDYSPGRWAWVLKNVVALPEPIPAKGKLGLWELDDALLPQEYR